MQPRITGPALGVPGVLDALRALGAAASEAGPPQTSTDLAHLRVSQINGGAVCLGMHELTVADDYRWFQPGR